MQIKDIKWPIVIITCAIAISLFLGIQYWRQKQLIEEPLMLALQEKQGVEEVSLLQKDKTLNIVLTMSKVDDFASFYQRIETKVEEMYRGDYDVTVVDAPDETLMAAYGNIHLAIYEAIDQGNYVSMGEYVAEVSQNYELDYNMVVLEEDIYLQLHHGDSFLYRRFPRFLPSKGDDVL